MTEERAKELAFKILESTEYYGEDYYKVEDYIVQILLGEEPQSIEFGPMYLRNTLRYEFREWVESEYGVTLENEEIEELVDKAYYHFSEDPLNLDFLQSIANKYMLERKMTIQGQTLKLEEK